MPHAHIEDRLVKLPGIGLFAALAGQPANGDDIPF
jgi:hypothetical protein